MATKRERLGERLRRRLEAENPAVIDPALANRLRQDLAPVSGRMFRDLLRESGHLLHPLVEGVRQEDLASLERTLLGLAQVYAKEPELRRECRQAVILAKDHAKLAARRPEREAVKKEMILWMMTWLENPAVFEAWVPLRRAVFNA